MNLSGRLLGYLSRTAGSGDVATIARRSFIDVGIAKYEFASARGEKQYFIRDSNDMQSTEDEIIALGGTLEWRGTVDEYPFFLIHWPPNGPRRNGARAFIPQNNSAGEGQ